MPAKTPARMTRTQRTELMADMLATALAVYQGMALGHGQDFAARPAAAATIAFGAYATRKLQHLHLGMPGVDPVVDPEHSMFRFRIQGLLEQTGALHDYGMAAWAAGLAESDAVYFGKRTVSLVQDWEVFLTRLGGVALGLGREDAYAWLNDHAIAGMARHAGE